MNLDKLGDEAYNQINTFYMKVKSGLRKMNEDASALLEVGTKTAVAAGATLVFGAFMGASLGATITLTAVVSISAFFYFTSQKGSKGIVGFLQNETSLIDDFEPMLKAAQSFYEIAQDKLESWRTSHRRRF